MLTRLEIRNFKQFEDVEIEMGNPVVFIGPNNSGKTTALQALALWDLGMRRWRETNRFVRQVVRSQSFLQATINRRDFVAASVPSADLLWRSAGSVSEAMHIAVSGTANSKVFRYELKFSRANEESFYCQISDSGGQSAEEVLALPLQEFAFLPSMSGLADREFAKQIGEIRFLIGQGRTAEVIRNLCIEAFNQGKWHAITEPMQKIFGFTFLEPRFIPERSELVLSYASKAGVFLDLSCAGRGVHQVLLLLAFMAVNPNSVLLLDEPDAHLEILRQKEVYKLLTETAAEQGSQIIAASPSEVILNEAAQKDVLVSFVGRPHRVDDRGTQTLKALREIGFDQYQQAEITGWILYLEGSTDLAILQSFALTLEHPAAGLLEKPFVHYIGNQPQKARDHFFGLREAMPNLTGLLICDRLPKELQSSEPLVETMWQRNEIENYVCQPETLMAFAKAEMNNSAAEAAMQAAIDDLIPPAALRERERLPGGVIRR